MAPSTTIGAVRPDNLRPAVKVVVSEASISYQADSRQSSVAVLNRSRRHLHGDDDASTVVTGHAAVSARGGGPLTQSPDPVFLDLSVHCIRCQVEAIGPSNGAKNYPNLAEIALMAQDCEHAHLRRVYEVRHVHIALSTVIESYTQTVTSKRLDLGHPPFGARRDFWDYFNGSIFFGISTRSHRLQSSSSSAR